MIRLLVAALVIATLSGCDDAELRAAEEALGAAAPEEFGMWRAAAAAREAAQEPVSEARLSMMQLMEDAGIDRLNQLERELYAEITAAQETRDELLEAAQEAERHYVDTWNERQGDLRFARPGFGIGVGNAAVAAVQRAHREAIQALEEFTAADAEADRIAEEAQAEYEAQTEEERTNLLDAFRPAERVLYVALEAEDAARQRLEEAAPEAWTAYEAQRVRSNERAGRMAEGLPRLMSFSIWAGLCIIPARIARRKGRSFWAWYAYGFLLLWPLAMIHSLKLKDETCPSCGAYAGGQSLACRSCGEALPS
ncbi:MAG: hypothetical protein OYL41_09850 [Acidobacteriota bacterium]|nr:hypothetical protein [Acidobacteriota bacterium]